MTEEAVPFNKKALTLKIKTAISIYRKKIESGAAEEADAYLAKSLTDIFCSTMEGVTVVIPKSNIIVENQVGTFEKVISQVKGYLSL